MKRVIKFRTWSRRLVLPNRTPEIDEIIYKVSCGEIDSAKYFRDLNAAYEKYYIWQMQYDSDPFCYNDAENAVNMQYIGCQDTCGIDLYEDDIVELRNTARGKIIFENCEFKIEPFGSWLAPSINKGNVDLYGILCIGNFFQNPELCKSSVMCPLSGES